MRFLSRDACDRISGRMLYIIRDRNPFISVRNQYIESDARRLIPLFEKKGDNGEKAETHIV